MFSNPCARRIDKILSAAELDEEEGKVKVELLSEEGLV
jgi:hypothetical protein